MHERPVAVTDGATILARNRVATEAGIVPGMRVAEATTRAADLVLAPYDPKRVQALWDVVLDQLDALGPLVEDAGLGHALVDLTGAGRSERLLIRRTLDTLHALLALHARAAVADGPFVALVAARRAREEGKAVVIPRGQSVAFLAPLPVSLLPLPERATAELALLGVRTVGAFTTLRLADIQQRFGGIGMTAFALAIGQDTRPLVPLPRERAETLAYPFEPPADDLAAVLFVTRTLLNGHAATLRREGLVAGGMRLVLAVEGGGTVVVEQRWGMATIPDTAEFDALRLALDARVADEWGAGETPRITDLALSLLDCGPNAGTQLPLFGAGMVQQRESVAHLLTRLHALLGAGGVTEAVPQDAYLPEEGWILRPYRATNVGTPYTKPALPRATLLPTIPGLVWCAPPEPVAVAWWGESPVTLRSGAIEQEIVAVLGPYLAEGRWWDTGRYMRAYWLLVTSDQTLHLVMENRRGGEWLRVGVAD